MKNMKQLEKVLLAVAIMCLSIHVCSQERIVTKQLPVVTNFEVLAEKQRQKAEFIISREFTEVEDGKEKYGEVSNEKSGKQFRRATTSSSLPSPQPLLTFLGSDRTLNPQDPMGAVGQDHILTSDNAVFRVHDKTGTILSSLKTYQTNGFWTGLITNGGYPADPWATYDPYSKRWIIIAALFRGSNGGLPIDLLIAVSKTSNPLGDWNKYKVLDKGGHTRSVGFNKKWIAVSGGLVFDKSILYNGQALSYTDISSSPLSRGRFVTTLDSSVNDLYLVRDYSYVNGVGQTTAINKVSGSVNTPAISHVGYIPTTDFPSGSTRSNIFYRNGSIWVAFGTSCGSWSQFCQNVEWAEIDVDSVHLAQSGVISNSGFNYTNASLAVNDSSDVIIGYTYSGTGIFPSAAYSFRYNNDQANSMRSTKIYKAGSNSCSPYRWGDYAISCADPDGHSLWTLQQAATPVGFPYTPCDKSFWAKVDLNPPCKNLTLTNDITSGVENYEAAIKIEANNQISSTAKVKYDAGRYILLNSGFTVDTGAVFRAVIDGCGGN